VTEVTTHSQNLKDLEKDISIKRREKIHSISKLVKILILGLAHTGLLLILGIMTEMYMQAKQVESVT
jgi:hypothetical protein